MSDHQTHESFRAPAERFRSSAELVLSPQTWTANLAGRLRNEIREMLAGEREVRCFVEGSRNLGHQSATLELVKGFVALTGFAGRVVIYYADYGTDRFHTTEDKIRLLLGLAAGTNLARYVWPVGDAQVLFHPYERRGEITGPVNFGLSGGADDLSVDFTRELQLRWFLRIQPFMWEGSDREKSHPFFQCSRIEGRDGRKLYLNDECPAFATLPIRQSDAFPAVGRRQVETGPAEPSGNDGADRSLIWPLHYLHNFERTASELLLKIVLLAQIVATATSRSVYVQSFGLAPEGGNRLRYVRLLDPAVCPPESLRIRLYEAFRHGTRMPAHRCYRLARSIRRLQGSGCDVTIGGASDNPRLFGVPPHDGKSVVYEHLGPVDRKTFQQTLFEADLPPVVEGQNSVNELLSWGLPYVQVFRPRRMVSPGFLRLDWNAEASSATSWLEALSAFLTRSLSEETGYGAPDGAEECLESRLETAAGVLCRCRDPEDVLARYFQALGDYFGREGRDKLFIALLAMRSLISRGA